MSGIPAQHRRGLLASIRVLTGTLVGIVCTRFDILISEIEQEKVRLGLILIWGLAVAFCVAMAVAFLSLLAVAIFWDDHRLAALGGISFIYVLLAVAFGWRLRCSMKRRSRLFAISLGELRKDQRGMET